MIEFERVFVPTVALVIGAYISYMGCKITSRPQHCSSEPGEPPKEPTYPNGSLYKMEKIQIKKPVAKPPIRVRAVPVPGYYATTVAERMLNVPEGTLYNWVQRGRITVHRMKESPYYYFKQEDIDMLIEKQKKNTEGKAHE